MVRGVFVDTWGWLSITHSREKRHAETSRFFSDYIKNKVPLITTDYVLDETITLIFRRQDKEKAKAFLGLLDGAEKNGQLFIERINSERFARAKEMKLKYIDKPDISFTDITSMLVMKELGMEAIMTADHHFIKVGMGFRLVP